MVVFMQDWEQIQSTGWTQQSKNTALGVSLRSNRPITDIISDTPEPSEHSSRSLSFPCLQQAQEQLHIDNSHPVS